MASLNISCINDVSDEDCMKCLVHGILYHCKTGCKDFDDGRSSKDQDEVNKNG